MRRHGLFGRAIFHLSFRTRLHRVRNLLLRMQGKSRFLPTVKMTICSNPDWRGVMLVKIYKL